MRGKYLIGVIRKRLRNFHSIGDRKYTPNLIIIMKKIIPVIAAIAASALIISCSDSGSGSSGSYPLKTCVVSGEPLGSMGEPYVINHNGTEVRLCCKSCLKDFKADPNRYLSMIK